MSDLNDKHIAVLCKAAAAVKDRGHEGDARLADSVLSIVASLAARSAPVAAPAPIAANDAERIARLLQSFADRLCNDTALGERYEGDESALREAIAYLRFDLRAAPTSTAADAKDAARLDFMAQHEAWIAWSKDGESCRVWHNDMDGDPRPFMGWGSINAWHPTAREAIDAAIATSADEVKS